MNSAWVALDDPVVPALLERTFGLRFPPGAPGRSLSLDDLSRIARHSGFTMNVRSTRLPLDIDLDAPHLLVRDQRFLTVISRGSEWLLLDAESRFVRLPERDVLRLLEASEGRESLDEVHSRMTRAGVTEKTAGRLVRALGTHRAQELADWLASHDGAIDAERFARFALESPGLLPLEWNERTPPEAVREVSFDRHMQLAEAGALRHAAADLLRNESRLLVWLAGLVLVGLPVGYALPLCLSYLIDRARLAGDAPAAVFGIFVCALVLGVVINAVRSIGFVRLGARIRIRLLNAFLFRLLGCRIQKLRALSDGDLSARLSDLFVAQQLLFGQTLPSILSALMLTGGLIYLATVAPMFLVPLGAAAALIGAVYALIAPRLRELTRERLVTTSSWRERLIERFENWKLFRHLDPENGMLPRIDPFLSATADLAQRGTALGAVLTWSTAAIALGFLGAAWLIGVRGYRGAEYSLGQFMVLMGLALGTFRGTLSLATLVTAWVRAEPSIRRLREIVAHTEPESDRPGVQSGRPAPWAGLEIRDVTFAWPHRDPVLSGFSLTVSESEWVAIVGRSGSGKSTLAYLLGGLVEPSAGTIEMNARTDGAFHLDDLRRRVAIVPQEPTLFDVTLRENIVTGLDSVTDAQLARALDMSDLASFVEKRRRGLDEFVGENGSQVSVGEKVRVALARALLREPRLLVLDETFGHLDEGTASRIVERLKNEKLAVILLTHDRSLARRCDRRFTLRDGRLAAMTEDD